MKVQEVDPQRITVGTRFRRDLGDLSDLIDSIKDLGIVQPITVNSRMVLVAGERRLKAAKELGLAKVPVIVREESSEEVDLREVELAENLFRKDLEWHERDSLMKKIFDLHAERDPSWSLKKQAELTDEGKTSVHRHITMANYLEAMPELVEFKDEASALKHIKKLEERAIVNELSKRSAKKAEQARQWADDHYKIGDAFSGLGKVQPGVVQFLEVDPPYGVDLPESKAKNKQNTAAEYKEISASEYPRFVRDLAKATFRVAAKDSFMVFWFGSRWFAMVRQELEAAGWKLSDVPAIWYKGGQGQTSSPDTFLASSYEPFWVCRKGMPRLRKAGRSNVFEFAPTPPTQKIHPTEKPLALMHEIMDTFTYPGFSICVPFLGSGITLLAAYDKELTGFGWDLDGRYKNEFVTRAKTKLMELKEKGNGKAS